MTIGCPVCTKELPDKFASYKENKIHNIHSFVDELNADVIAMSDPVVRGRMKEHWDKI